MVEGDSASSSYNPEEEGLPASQDLSPESLTFAQYQRYLELISKPSEELPPKLQELLQDVPHDDLYVSQRIILNWLLSQ